MSKYGAKHLQWAPFAATTPEPDNALPNYGTPVNLGALQKVTDTPSYNEAKAYGDNVLKEYVNEFKECAVDVELTELSNSVASGLFGATLTTETTAELQFCDSDSMPYGGLGFVVCKQIDNVKKYQGIYYPKVKAAMQGEEYNAKGDSITLTGGKLKFTATAAKNGQWKTQSAELDTEAAATAWVDTKIVAAGA